MKTFSYTITHPLGLHARPCFALSGAAGEYDCRVTVAKGAEATDASNRLGLVGLAVVTGDELVFTFEGADEEQAAKDLRELLVALDTDRDE